MSNEFPLLHIVAFSTSLFVFRSSDRSNRSSESNCQMLLCISISPKLFQDVAHIGFSVLCPEKAVRQYSLCGWMSICIFVFFVKEVILEHCTDMLLHILLYYWERRITGWAFFFGFRDISSTQRCVHRLKNSSLILLFIASIFDIPIGDAKKQFMP
jgi:hypothetical protein